MNSLRSLHLYLGCAFAPLLVFFIFTGFLQTFDLHEREKGGTYRPPAWIAAAASVHMHQRLPPPDKQKGGARIPMRIVVVATCLGLFATTTLGLVMAWSMRKSRKGVLLALAAGTIVPIAVVFLQSRLP